MSSPDLVAVVTPSTVNDLLGGPLRGKASSVQIPTDDNPQTVINVEVSMEDLLGVAQDVQATIDQGQLNPNGGFIWMNLWITSPEEVNEDAWFGDEGLVSLSAWGDE